MTFKIVCVGKLKEKYWTDAEQEYLKRLQKYSQVQIVEIKECKIPKNPSQKDIESVIEQESSMLLEKVGNGFVIALTPEAKIITSEAFAEKIQDIHTYQNDTIIFLIGGSHGLSEQSKKQSKLRLSFSKMTFPHQLMRIILLEQIYRAMKITNNEPYHK